MSIQYVNDNTVRSDDRIDATQSFANREKIDLTAILIQFEAAKSKLKTGKKGEDGATRDGFLQSREKASQSQDRITALTGEVKALRLQHAAENDDTRKLELAAQIANKEADIRTEGYNLSEAERNAKQTLELSQSLEKQLSSIAANMAGNSRKVIDSFN